jgi:hypothetical protein
MKRRAQASEQGLSERGPARANEKGALFCSQAPNIRALIPWTSPIYLVLNQNGLEAANRSDPSTLTLPCTLYTPVIDGPPI